MAATCTAVAKFKAQDGHRKKKELLEQLENLKAEVPQLCDRWLCSQGQ